MPTSWPRTALNVMQEIAGRIGAPLDTRTSSTIGLEYIEDTALEMSMREVAGYIAAQNGGNWTITDSGKLYLVPIGMPEVSTDSGTQAVVREDYLYLPATNGGNDTITSEGYLYFPATNGGHQTITDDGYLYLSASGTSPGISAHNAESLSVSDPLEPWSGVRVFWDGDEWAAQDPEFGDDTLVIVKRGDEIGFAGDESGRVLEVKIAFGQSATKHPETMWNRGAARMLESIRGDVYYPFQAVNAVLDPALEIGDGVTLPEGIAVLCGISGELDGLCAVDASAPPDEAINTAYPANWLRIGGGE